MKLDKKARAGGLRFVLWSGPGRAQVVADVPESAVIAALHEG
jgi:3-dehydroquinate synthetase